MSALPRIGEGCCGPSESPFDLTKYMPMEIRTDLKRDLIKLLASYGYTVAMVDLTSEFTAITNERLHITLDCQNLPVPTKPKDALEPESWP